jgi:hypothetical protein
MQHLRLRKVLWTVQSKRAGESTSGVIKMGLQGAGYCSRMGATHAPRRSFILLLFEESASIAYSYMVKALMPRIREFSLMPMFETL